ncbi:hypothetical protein ACA910_018362 [Epithemia clementina (nom. ined.)]
MMPTPSLPTIAEIAQENGFSTLVQALIATDLVTAVDEDSDADLAVFAPTNDAFATLGDVALNYLVANPDLMSMILQYHIVAGINTSQDLAGMTSPVVMTTLLGSTIEIIINGDGIFVQGTGNLDPTNLSQVTARRPFVVQRCGSRGRPSYFAFFAHWRDCRRQWFFVIAQGLDWHRSH